MNFEITTLTHDSQEKLALLGLGKLDQATAFAGLDEIDKECNLVEVVESILKERGIKYRAREIVCEGRVRAAIVIEDS